MATSPTAAGSAGHLVADVTRNLSAEEFCERYAGRVYQFSRMVARSELEADDLAQAALERVLRRLPQYDHTRGEATAWLWRIVTNVAADAGRSARRRHLLFRRLVALRGHEEAADVGIPHGIEDAALLAAVRSLTPSQRSVVALRFGADLDYQAVGQALGISAAAATRCGNRALAALRTRLVEDPS
ncbi:MAG: RNA polymerase sigma factor [Candidatus Dormibacteria bacterium]